MGRDNKLSKVSEVFYEMTLCLVDNGFYWLLNFYSIWLVKQIFILG